MLNVFHNHKQILQLWSKTKLILGQLQSWDSDFPLRKYFWQLRQIQGGGIDGGWCGTRWPPIHPLFSPSANCDGSSQLQDMAANITEMLFHAFIQRWNLQSSFLRAPIWAGPPGMAFHKSVFPESKDRILKENFILMKGIILFIMMIMSNCPGQ